MSLPSPCPRVGCSRAQPCPEHARLLTVGLTCYIEDHLAGARNCPACHASDGEGDMTTSIHDVADDADGSQAIASAMDRPLWCPEPGTTVREPIRVDGTAFTTHTTPHGRRLMISELRDGRLICYAMLDLAGVQAYAQQIQQAIAVLSR